MKITNDIFYVGVNDHELDLFEGQYVVPNGMAYNSYVIMDEKIAVMDTVDVRFGDEWLANLHAVLGDRSPDFLVVQHMEPDHSANITAFMQAYPSATVVASERAFVIMKQFFGKDYPERRIVVKIPEDLDYYGMFDDLFDAYTSEVSLESVRTTNMGSLFKLRYVICLKDASREKEFIDELRCRNGNLEILISEKEDSVNEL